MTQVYLVRAAHPFVPGEPMSLHASMQGARKAAAELVNIIRKDICYSPHGCKVETATADNYEEVLETLREAYEDLYDSNSFDVWIVETEIKP